MKRDTIEKTPPAGNPVTASELVMNEMSHAIDGLEKALETLTERVRPFASNATPAKELCEEAVRSLPPYFEAVREQTWRIERIRCAMEALAESIDP